MKNETLQGTCICGNTSDYDKDSFKGSTISINGVDIVLDCGCEDELLQKLAKRRGLKIRFGDGGEIDVIVMTQQLRGVKLRFEKPKVRK